MLARLGDGPKGYRDLATDHDAPSRALDERDRLAQLRAAHGRGAARTRRARRLLDVLVRQLAADAAVRQGVGTSGIATAGSSSSARTRPSSASSTTSTTCVARRASSASATRSSSTTTSRSGGRSRTTTGRPSTSSIATGGSASTISARAPTRRPSERSSSCWASTRRLVRVDAGGLAEAADWDTLRIPGDLPRPRAAASAAVDSRADGLALNQWALAGDVVGRRGGRRARRGRRLDHLPLRGARPQPRPRAAGRRRSASASPCASTVSRPAMTTASTSTRPARAPSPSRGCTSSSASERPVAERDLRDHVPRPGRARLRLHLRLRSPVS